MRNITFDLLWSSEKFSFENTVTIEDIPLFGDIPEEKLKLLNQNGYLTFLSIGISNLGDPSEYFKFKDLEDIRKAMQGAIEVLMQDSDNIFENKFEYADLIHLTTNILAHLFQYSSDVFQYLSKLSRFNYRYEVHDSHEKIDEIDPNYIDDNGFDIVNDYDFGHVILLRI